MKKGKTLGIACPHCGEPIGYLPNDEDKSFPCLHCNAMITLNGCNITKPKARVQSPADKDKQSSRRAAISRSNIDEHRKPRKLLFTKRRWGQIFAYSFFGCLLLALLAARVLLYAFDDTNYEGEFGVAFKDIQWSDKKLGLMLLAPMLLLVPLYFLQYDAEEEARRAEQRLRQKAMTERLAEERRADRLRRICRNPNVCPSCGSQDICVEIPSKPGVFAPTSLSGIILTAASSALADAIFEPERVCMTCGDRWPAPNYK
jgi:hypothetical protein